MKRKNTERIVKRYKVGTTLGGGVYGYCVIDNLSHSPWGKRFNITKTEAIKIFICDYWNKTKKWDLSFWDMLCGISKYDVKEVKIELK